MPKATYSEQLLTDICNGTWREPELDLSGEKLDAVAAQKLANALAHNITLTSLNLFNNNIGAKGTKAFAQNTTLTSLDLRSNNIDVEGARAMAQNTTLTSLKLADNKIGAEGAKALAQNTTLTSLDLGFNFIGDMEEKAISEMLLRNKKFRQASLINFINQIIPVPDLISTILKYSADYMAEEARQHTSKAIKSDKQVAEELTHSQTITTNTSTGNQPASASVNGFSSGASVNSNSANSHAQITGSASSEGRGFFKASCVAKVDNNNDQPATATLALVKK